MNRLVRAAALALVASALSAAPASAQAPPDPLPMGVPYLYQPGNPYWYRPLAYSPNPLYGYPSYYPFGATGPIYGRYSWDYDVYYAAGVGWYQSNMPAFPYQFRYPTYSYNYAWKGFGW